MNNKKKTINHLSYSVVILFLFIYEHLEMEICGNSNTMKNLIFLDVFNVVIDVSNTSLFRNWFWDVQCTLSLHNSAYT